MPGMKRTLTLVIAATLALSACGGSDDEETPQQQTAARALTELMLRIRLVSYYPELTGTVPVRQLCRVAAGAGSAILAASAQRGPARERAFAELAHRWRAAPK